MNKTFAFVILLCILAALGALFVLGRKPKVVVSSFEECQAAGYPVLESYPAQCKTPDGKTFTQDIGNELEKTDLITIASPKPGTTVSSPLQISGQARGYWFFEASFPIKLLDEQGTELANGIATAQGEWMTEEFVPYTAELIFTKPASKKGTLILMKDNPSGLPENDDSLRVPVTFW
jgi:hypothetical protein